MIRASLLGPLPPDALHVMTFNVRRRLGALSPRRADRWGERRPRVAALLRAEQPTVLGVQEAMPDQAAAIGDALGESYRQVGHGRRSDGTGEACPVYYDADRLELLDWSQEALSDTPTIPGSMSWGNRMPRVQVRLALQDRATGATFAFVNTHLDPFSRRSRVRAAAALREGARLTGGPSIVAGDLNAGVGSSTLRELLADDVLQDAWTTARRRETPAWGTFANYRSPKSGAGRIDWLAVSASVEVLRVGINARRYDGGWPSDHLPVQAHVRVRPGEERG